MRSARRWVAADRAVSSAAPTTWPATTLVDAPDRRGDLLRAAVGLSVAAPARQLSAVAHGLPMVLGAAGRCCVRRSEEHTSELQSLMRISYAVSCLKKKREDILT